MKKRSHQFLVIDVGNTRTKWTIATPDRIGRVHDLPTADLVRVRRSLSRFSCNKPVEGALIACVVPAALAPLKTQLHALGIRQPRVVSSRLDLGLKLRCRNPRRVGADRIANAVAAAHLCGVPVIAVSIGTAITFDVVSARREFLGGVIAAGPRVMLDYLHDRTALLPRCDLKPSRSAIGRDTVEALQAGAWHGARGLIREILGAIRRELRARRRVPVIATGGYGGPLATGIPEIDQVVPHLTLEGLRILYARNTP